MRSVRRLFLPFPGRWLSADNSGFSGHLPLSQNHHRLCGISNSFLWWQVGRYKHVVYQSYPLIVPLPCFSRLFETVPTAEPPHCLFLVPQKWFGSSRSGRIEYAAYPNICPTSRRVPPHFLVRQTPFRSVSAVWSVVLPSFLHTVCSPPCRKVLSYSLQKNRCKRPRSLPPRFGRTGRYRHRLPSYPFAEIPTGSRPSPKQLRDY